MFDHFVGLALNDLNMPLYFYLMEALLHLEHLNYIFKTDRRYLNFENIIVSCLEWNSFFINFKAEQTHIKKPEFYRG